MPSRDPSRNITLETFEGMSQKSESIFLPVLLDIMHPDIYWEYPESEDPEVLKKRQQNGHLRLVYDPKGMMYKGDNDAPVWYAPCFFSIKMPKEDGKSKGDTTISISCVDSRIIEVIRSIDEDLTCHIDALYSKINSENGKVRYTFTKLHGRNFEMGDVTWDGLQAQWNLNPDSIMDLNIPKDMGSRFRLPSITEKN